METSYGIAVTNRYKLFLDDDEDPLEVLKVQEQAKEAKKKTKLCEKENKGKSESKVKPPPNARKGIKDTQNVKSAEKGTVKEVEQPKNKPPQRPVPDRGDRNVKFSNDSRDREERNNRRNREDKTFFTPGSEFNRDGRDRDLGRPDNPDFPGRGRGTRGMFRGMRNTRGMRGGSRGGYDNRGKREYDRQSGSDKTGVKPVDKREGGGAHNWGNHRDEIQEQLNTNQLQDESDWNVDKQEDTSGIQDTSLSKEPEPVEGGGGGGEGETAPPVEEEPNEMTLDEYKALRGNRQKPVYNLRKAGEGEDPSQWKKMYALAKKKEGDEDDDDEEEYDASEYPQRVGRQKHVLDIDIHFADSRRGSRARGRGGPRGRAFNRGLASGANRGGNNVRERVDNYQARTPQKSAPKVDDDHDFPKLCKLVINE